MASRRQKRTFVRAARRSDQDVRRSADEADGTEESGEAARRMVDVGESMSRAAAENARTSADAAERAARAGAEVLERNTEAVQQVLQSGMDMTSRLAERSTQQFARLFGFASDQGNGAAEQSSRNLEAIVESSATMAQGIQSISREWLEFSRSRMEKNLNQMNALLRCRTPHDLVAAQSEMLRGNLEGLLESSRRIAETSLRMADEASRRMSERLRQQGEEMQRQQRRAA